MTESILSADLRERFAGRVARLINKWAQYPTHAREAADYAYGEARTRAMSGRLGEGIAARRVAPSR